MFYSVCLANRIYINCEKRKSLDFLLLQIDYCARVVIRYFVTILSTRLTIFYSFFTTSHAHERFIPELIVKCVWIIRDDVMILVMREMPQYGNNVAFIKMISLSCLEETT